MQTTPADLTAQTDPTAQTMADAMDDAPDDARASAAVKPGWVWALPGGPGCAGHARAILRVALPSLGVPRDVIADARLMVSELATNAHQHAGEHGPHELWLYEAGDDPGAGEVRCAVFDALVDSSLPGYSWTSGDCGRGLSIVHELSEGHWGTRRTLSRLGPPVRGKAVWFAVPGSVAAFS